MRERHGERRRRLGLAETHSRHSKTTRTRKESTQEKSSRDSSSFQKHKHSTLLPMAH